MPRIWLSGPRLFGLVRPGISFSTSELRAKERRREDDPVCTVKELPRPRMIFVVLVILGYLAKAIMIGALLFACGWFLMVLATTLAHASTCHVYQDGGYAVTACEDGTFTVRDRDGKVRQYGERNGGFERYPGQEGRPVFEQR